MLKPSNSVVVDGFAGVPRFTGRLLRWVFGRIRKWLRTLSNWVLLANGEFPAIQILETSRLEETSHNLVPVHMAPMAWLLAGIADQTGCLILLIP